VSGNSGSWLREQMKVTDFLKSVLPVRTPRAQIRFTGNYKSWAEAARESTGYASPEILEKTRAGLMKVKRGEAAFERDSVTFEAMEHESSLLAGLTRAATADEGRLSVLDFGGSLGGTYFQYRQFLSGVKELRWSVVDQPAHVDCGETDFANNELRFYKTIEDCLSDQQPNVLLLLSVIQYLPEPYLFLENVSRKQIPNIIVERTAFTRSGCDRLTVQHVPAWIYDASYPAWFLSEPSFRKILASRYDLVCEYVAAEDFHPEGEEAVFKGFQFQLKSGRNRA
jgi:putative methyltransferase (TIGR04325 family)